MNMLILYLMNLTVAASSLLAVRRFFGDLSRCDKVCAFFTVFVAQVVLMLQALGIFGRLTLANVCLMSMAGLFLAARLSLGRGSSLSFSGIGGNMLDLSEIVFVSAPAKFAVAVICAFAAVKLAVNLMNAPFGWDSLNYHFTFAVEWLKHGDLNAPVVVSCDPAPTYYPINGSLIFLWSMLPLQNVFIADLSQAVFFAAAFAGAYSLAKKVGLSKEYSLYSACLFSLIPNYFKQLDIAYVDIMVAAFFILSVNFLFCLKERFFFSNALLFSVSSGIMLGLKTVALPYFILLVSPFAYLCFRKAGAKRALIFFFPAVLAAVALGGFGYIRNFIQTSNPLYPVDVSVFGREIFKGVVDGASYRFGTSVKEYSIFKMLFSEGLGAQTVLLIFPSMFLGFAVYILRRSKRPDFITGYFMLLPVLIFLVYRFLIPLANLRYIYALLGFGVIIAFFLLDKFKAPALAVKTVLVVCVLASMGELAKRSELVVSIILSLAVFLVLLRLKAVDIARWGRLLAVSACAVILVVLPFLERHYLRHESDSYVKMCKRSGFWPDAASAWRWINDNTAGNNNIAYVGRPVPFALYGNMFRNNVYYASINSVDPVKLHYFKHSRYSWHDPESSHRSFRADGNYRGNADYAAWVDNLFRRRTDYLFIYSLHKIEPPRFPLEDEWALGHPERFKPVFSNATVRIYKIVLAQDNPGIRGE